VRVARPLSFACSVAVAGTLIACGGDAPAGPSDPPGPPVNTNVITITAAGASPRNIQVALGSRVRFVNNDSRPHWMASDPHPEHDDCPEFDPVGTLLPGQSRETANLVQPMTCGFHDHDNPNVTSLQGQVTIR
jgi:plastocyanin